MDTPTAEWLSTAAGGAAISAGAQAYEDAPDPVGAATRLRRDLPGLSPAQAAAALTQASLRTKARAKFGADADRMLFTPEALEQATRRSVATHRAARLAAAQVGSVLDLGCSIGGDLIAFARAGLIAAGIDTDPVRVALAGANLAALDLAGAVRVAEARDVDTAPFGAVFCDPARRGARGRIFDADGWSPTWDFVAHLLGGTACVKTAPGIPHSLVPPGVEAEWVSQAGEVKEAALWSPSLAVAKRRATVIGPAGGTGIGSGAGSGGLATLTDEDDPGGEVHDLAEYLYEPDGAVIRAGLVTAVAAQVGGGLLSAPIAYVTAPTRVPTPFARCYRVLEELPFKEKRLKAELRARNIGTLTIKTRGVASTPEQVRRRLALRGSVAATVVLTRARDRGVALLVEPC